MTHQRLLPFVLASLAVMGCGSGTSEVSFTGGELGGASGAGASAGAGGGIAGSGGVLEAGAAGSGGIDIDGAAGSGGSGANVDATAGGNGGGGAGGVGGTGGGGVGGVGGTGGDGTGGASAGGGAGGAGGAGTGGSGGADSSTDGGGTGGSGGVDSSIDDASTDEGGGADGGNPTVSGGACTFPIDLIRYDTAEPGCTSAIPDGGTAYSVCKGQIHFINTSGSPLTAPVIRFTVGAGVVCLATNADADWTITDNGASSGRCVFTGTGFASAPITTGFSFGFDTTGSAVPTGIEVDGCGGAGDSAVSDDAGTLDGAAAPDGSSDSQAGDEPCVAETDTHFCQRLGANCGSVTANDNCGVSRTVADCGACAPPQTCNAATLNVCGDVAETDAELCARLGKNCGSVTANDKYGVLRTVASCGDCTAPQTCGAATANVCGCVYEGDTTFCSRLGRGCGDATEPDNCGTIRTVLCGWCTPPQNCVDGKYCGDVAESDATFCARLGKNCGTVTGVDNFGSTRTVASCGVCIAPQTCGASTANVCGCVAESNAAFCTRLGKTCGTVAAADNCGALRTVNSCGTCAGPQVCGVTNVCGAVACNTAYGGTARAITSRIQAEDFDNGGEGCAYHDLEAVNQGNAYRATGVDIEGTPDTGGGYNVGWTRAGEWLKFTVTVAASGRYDFSFRVANTAGMTDAFHVEDENGTNLTGNVNIPATGGGQIYANVIVTGVALTAGPHVLKIAVDNGAMGAAWNFNYFTATAGAACVAESDVDFCSRLGKTCGVVTGNDNCAVVRTVASCGTCIAPQVCAASGTCAD